MRGEAGHPPSSTPPRAWVVLGLSFLALFAALGIRMSFGAFVRAWEETFGVGRSAISVVSSVSLLVYGFGTPVVGRLTDRVGARAMLTASLALMGVGLCGCSYARSVGHLVFLYGILASVGLCGASSVTVSVAVLQWFPTRRGLAMGVTSCGIAAGQMLIAPLSLHLIQTVGWRRTLLGFGLGTALVLSTVIWLFFRDAPHGRLQGSAPSPARGPEQAPPRLTAVGLGVLPLVLLPYFVCGFTDLGLFSTHFIPLAQGRAFSPQVIAWAVGLDAGANVVGNVLTGYLADKVRITALLAVMYLVRAAGFAVLLGASDPATLLVFAAINGSVEASSIAPTAALCAQLYGPGRVGTVFGLVSSFHQFGGAAGAFLAGALFARSGTYAGGLTVAIGLLVVGSSLCWALQTRLARRPGGVGRPGRSILRP